MTAQVAAPSRFGQAIRVLLVFLLVFSLSFQAEIAIAAGYTTGGLKGHDDDTITNMTVFQLSADDDKEIGAKVRNASDTADDEPAEGVTVDVKDDEVVKFVAVPKWSSDTDSSSDEDKVIADFVEWYIAGDKVSSDAILAINKASFGGKDSVKVTCKLSDEAQEYVAESFSEKHEGKFQVSFTATYSETPEVAPGYELSLSGDGLEPPASDLVLERDAGASFPEYQFAATFRAYDSNTSETLYTYEGSTGEGLAEMSGGVLADGLTWEVFTEDGDVDDEAATIADGALVVSKDGVYTVKCTVNDATGVSSCSSEVSVTAKTAGEPEPTSSSSSSSSSSEEPEVDYQSASNPQSELAITARILESALSDEADASSSSSTSSSSASSSASKVVERKNTYTRSEIEKLDSSQETYSMNSGTLGSISITGAGPTLETLFENFGIIDLSEISEVKFISDDGQEKTLSWSALASSSPSPLLAVTSYVAEPESESSDSEDESDAESSGESTESESSSASESAESESSSSNGGSESSSSSSSSSSSNAPTLLDNTCFRLLFDGGASGLASADADSFRWVKEIVINPESEITPDNPDDPAPFSVSIDYAPAPIGQVAIFSPKPSEELPNGTTFDFLWEESSDGGKTWETVGTNQTYRVTTTKKNIGHLVRVTLKSDVKNEKTGKPYDATSEPVEIEEGTGFIVQLDYDPPEAGGVALFQAKIIDTVGDVDQKKLKYVWQVTQDGGKNWTDLNESYQGKSTCMIQTYDADDDSEAAKLSYIRVHVVEKEGKKRERDSNMQPLTVHTSESKQKDNKADKRDESEESDDSNSGGGKGGNGDGRKNGRSAGISETPTYEPIDLSQVNVDGDVTNQIIEQEEAAQADYEASVPGARWTKISASQDSGDDVRNLLAENPFAPLAIPVGLGFTVAGGLEKLLTFRRQL